MKSCCLKRKQFLYIFSSSYSLESQYETSNDMILDDGFFTV